MINIHGYQVNPETGIVIGRRGKPVTRIGGRYLHIEKFPGGGKYVHRLVWEAVNGPIPDGMQVNHKNGIRTDNRIANLELVTPSENTLHAFRTGLARADGEHNGRAIGKRRSAGGAA